MSIGRLNVDDLLNTARHCLRGTGESVPGAVASGRGDCGMRISDCGLETQPAVHQSAFRIPQSTRPVATAPGTDRNPLPDVCSCCPSARSSFRRDLFYFFRARAALCASFRVERAARRAAVVHCAGEPVGEKRARAQNADKHGDAQQRVSQRPYFSRNDSW